MALGGQNARKPDKPTVFRSSRVTEGAKIEDSRRTFGPTPKTGTILSIVVVEKCGTASLDLLPESSGAPCRKGAAEPSPQGPTEKEKTATDRQPSAQSWRALFERRFSGLTSGL